MNNCNIHSQANSDWFRAHNITKATRTDWEENVLLWNGQLAVSAKLTQQHLKPTHKLCTESRKEGCYFWSVMPWVNPFLKGSKSHHSPRYTTHDPCPRKISGHARTQFRLLLDSQRRNIPRSDILLPATVCWASKLSESRRNNRDDPRELDIKNADSQDHCPTNQRCNCDQLQCHTQNAFLLTV